MTQPINRKDAERPPEREALFLLRVRSNQDTRAPEFLGGSSRISQEQEMWRAAEAANVKFVHGLMFFDSLNPPDISLPTLLRDTARSSGLTLLYVVDRRYLCRDEGDLETGLDFYVAWLENEGIQVVEAAPIEKRL